MPKPKESKTTIVREHPRKLHSKNQDPIKITIVDQHPRILTGRSLAKDEMFSIFETYSKESITYPRPHELEFKGRGNKYDDLIAVWTDYFNKIYADSALPIDPDAIKALIGSESGFDPDPTSNKVAFGITQITKQTLAALQDSKGEAKDFIFKDIRLKDLKDPNVAIPLAIRWLFRKNQTATAKLGRPPSIEEIILEYKGLLKSKSKYKEKAISRFNELYALLKKK